MESGEATSLKSKHKSNDLTVSILHQMLFYSKEKLLKGKFNHSINVIYSDSGNRLKIQQVLLHDGRNLLCLMYLQIAEKIKSNLKKVYDIKSLIRSCVSPLVKYDMETN